LVVQVPGQHMTALNWNIVPQNETELAYSNFTGSGIYIYTATVSPKYTVCCSVGDGFKLAQLFRIPILNYTVGALAKSQGAVNGRLRYPGANRGVRSVVGNYFNVRAVTDAAIDVVSSVNDLVQSFDTPNNGADAQPVVARQCVNLANMVGMTHAQVLAPMEGEPPITNLPIATSMSETRLLTIGMIPTLYGRYRVTTSDEPLASPPVFVIPITPCPLTYLTTPPAVLDNMLACEYVSIPFTFWRGSLIYTIQFVGSQFVNARFGFVTRYGRFGDTITVANMSSQYAITYDYGQTDTIRIRVDYQSNYPWSYVPSYNTPVQGSAIGELIMVILNPLSGNETVSDTMDINVFISLGEDFELRTPGANLSYFKMIPDVGKETKEEPEAKAQMMRTGVTGGVAFDDEKKDVDARPTGGVQVPEMVNDGPNEVFDRQYLVASANWLTSSTLGSIIYAARVPFGMIPAGPLTQIFNSFVYKKMKMHVVVQIQSNMFQQGQICCFFCPQGVDASTITYQEMTLGPHVLLKAGHTTSGTIEIPFVHPLDGLDATYASSELGTLGTFNIAVFNTLLVGSSAPLASQNCRIAVNVKFSQMDLSIPDPDLVTPSLGGVGVDFDMVDQS